MHWGAGEIKEPSGDSFLLAKHLFAKQRIPAGAHIPVLLTPKCVCVLEANLPDTPSTAQVPYRTLGRGRLWEEGNSVGANPGDKSDRVTSFLISPISFTEDANLRPPS